MQSREPTEAGPRGAGMPPAKGAAAPSSDRPLRRFLVIGLIGWLAVTASLFGLERWRAARQAVEQTAQANAQLAQAFANTLTAEQWSFIARTAAAKPQQLRADPAVAALRAEALRQMRGLPVAKVKIYNPAGVAVFSTNEYEIGEQKAASDGLRRAQAGEPVSGLTWRDRMDAPGRVLYGREIVDTMVAVAVPGGGAARAVVELHADATELLAARRQAAWLPAGVAGLLLAVLLAVLWAGVRRADAALRGNAALHAAQERATRRAVFQDALTGLPNRLGFVERLSEVVASAKGGGRPAALMSIGLDRFKAVNEALGLGSGDRVLHEVARRLEISLRDGDQAFRLGGDEFAATLPGVLTPEDATRVAQRIQRLVGEPMQIDGREVRLSVTIGIAFYPRDAKDAETLLRRAEEAMHGAKGQGGGAHAFSPASPVPPEHFRL